MQGYSLPPKPGAHVHLVQVDAQQLAALCEYIQQSFVQEQGRPVMIDHPGYNEADRFFEGQGSYHLFRTCNQWTNGALREMGAEVGVWTPFDWSVRRHLPVNEGRRQ